MTALGDTLLHMAALPLTASHIVVRNPAVAQSLYCARTLDSWISHRRPNPLHMQFAAPGDLGSEQPQPLSKAEQRAQRATIGLLVHRRGHDVRVKDVDGNTALHYLAGTLNVDEAVPEMVRAGEEVWESAQNWCMTYVK